MKIKCVREMRLGFRWPWYLEACFRIMLEMKFMDEAKRLRPREWGLRPLPSTNHVTIALTTLMASCLSGARLSITAPASIIMSAVHRPHLLLPRFLSWKLSRFVTTALKILSPAFS